MYCTNCGTLRPESRPRFCRACGVEYEATAPTEVIAPASPTDPWSSYQQSGTGAESASQFHGTWSHQEYPQSGGSGQDPAAPAPQWDYGQPGWASSVQIADGAAQPVGGSRRPLLAAVLAVVALLLGLTIGYLAVGAIYPI